MLSRLAEVLEPGAWVINRESAFKIDVPLLTPRHKALVAEQQRGAQAKPGLELGIEGEGIEEGPSLRRVVFSAIEDGPPAAPRARDNLRQTFAGIAGRDNIN